MARNRQVYARVEKSVKKLLAIDHSYKRPLNEKKVPV